MLDICRFGGSSTLTLSTFLSGFFLILIFPFQFVISFYCWTKIAELGFHSGCSDVNVRLICSLTSIIPLGLLVGR